MTIDTKKTFEGIARERINKLTEWLARYEQDFPLDNRIMKVIEHLKTTDFFYGPSSTKWHGAYPGGGFDHAFNVMTELVDLTVRNVCRWENGDPVIVGLLHDYTKIGAYKLESLGDPETGATDFRYEWDKDAYHASPIHGEDSVLRVQSWLELTEEEVDCIRWHMGAYEGKESWGGFDAAIKRHPSVLWTHTADMYASKVMEGGQNIAN